MIRPGSIILDTALDRRGTVITVDAERLMVLVSWRAGQASSLDPEQIRSGRYQIQL